MELECDVCFEPLDEQERRPKVLPCGHTTCLQCAGNLPGRRCPQCRQELKGAAQTLPDNFCVLSLIRGTSRGAHLAKRWWCVDCSAAASKACEDGHTVRKPRAALRRELDDAVPRACEELRGLRGLQASGGPQVLAALKLLTGPDVNVTLRQEGGASFDAHLKLAGDPLLRALVVVLAERGALVESDCKERLCGEEVPISSSVAKVSKMWAAREPSTELGKEELIQKIKAGHQEVHSVYVPDYASAWKLRLLQAIAPRVNMMDITISNRQELLEVHAMPRLRRLIVDVTLTPFEGDRSLTATGGPRCGLEKLFVGGPGLPRETTEALLRANADTLQELALCAGTAGDGEWPHYGNGLHCLLSGCQMTALRRLTLSRNFDWEPFKEYQHDVERCREQVEALRRVLPGVAVVCNACDSIPDFFFENFFG